MHWSIGSVHSYNANQWCRLIIRDEHQVTALIFYIHVCLIGEGEQAGAAEIGAQRWPTAVQNWEVGCSLCHLIERKRTAAIASPDCCGRVVSRTVGHHCEVGVVGGKSRVTVVVLLVGVLWPRNYLKVVNVHDLMFSITTLLFDIKLNMVVVVLFMVLPAVFRITLPVCVLALMERTVLGDVTWTALDSIKQLAS